MTNLSDWLSCKAEEALTSLLEDKHLYQSLQIDLDTYVTEARESGLLEMHGAETIVRELFRANWRPHDDEVEDHRPEHLKPTGTQPPHDIVFFMRTIKCSCATCGAVTPMNLTRSLNIHTDPEDRRPPAEPSPDCQDFVLLFQCQSCRSAPDTFLIRKRGLKLTLCGRAPMEKVNVPRAIPKNVRRYYSGGVVAFQSGQTLAGLFLLRVLIEQYVRSCVPGSESMKVDKVLDAYMALLPEDFKRRFPSLKEAYSLLSEAIHAARESPELFDDISKKISSHFEAFQIFEKASGGKLLGSGDE